MLKKDIYIFLFLVFPACDNKQPKPILVWKEPVTEMEFIKISKGSFYMGNPVAETSGSNSEAQHLVTLTHDFWIGRMEVTREQWQKVMGNEELHPEKPSPFRNDNPKYPVVSKSYFDVQNFLQKLEILSPGNRFRLPTEAEWEYACRGGTSTNFNTGMQISDSLANYNAEIPSTYSSIGKYIGHPTPVGSYTPNLWGLYDMHGNVWEWVSDWYAPYSPEKAINPQGPQSNTLKIIRGGSWYFAADNARSSARGTHPPQLWGFSIGFRIVCEKKLEQTIEGGTVTDIDKNVYKTAVIGKYVWMAENLKTTTLNNGTKIPNITGNSNWAGLSTGAYCWYNDNKTNADTYGALYNWYIVNTGILCPIGWRVPSDNEWKYLEGYVDSIHGVGDSVWNNSGLRGIDAGKRLKAISGWRLGGNGSDDFSFSALPGGERLNSFNNTGGSSGFWWSSNENGASSAWYRCITYSFEEVARDIHPKKMGFSVRCLKDK
jgi:uncharacterized protein (TIGR02145 family)